MVAHQLQPLHQDSHRLGRMALNYQANHKNQEHLMLPNLERSQQQNNQEHSQEHQEAHNQKRQEQLNQEHQELNQNHRNQESQQRHQGVKPQDQTPIQPEIPLLGDLMPSERVVTLVQEVRLERYLIQE